MKRQRQVLVSVLLLSLLLLMACAPQASPSPAAPSAPSPAAAPAPAARAPVAAPVKSEWETLVEAAKKEGSIVLYCSASADVRAAVGRGLKERYGISTEWVAGRGAEIREKLISERRAGLYVADIYIGGTNSMVAALKPANAFDPLAPALLLPEVLDPNVWWEGKLPWVDKDRQIFGSLAFPTIAVAINTNLAKPDEIKSWRDLLNPKWKGKIAINDPTITGPGLRPFQAMLLNLIPGTGESYLRELAQQEPLVVRDQRLQVDWLAQGKVAILTGPDPPHPSGNSEKLELLLWSWYPRKVQ